MENQSNDKLDTKKEKIKASEEDIKKIKEEIEEYHRLAQLEANQRKSQLEFISTFSSVSKKYIWVFLVLALIFSCVNYYLFPMMFPLTSIADRIGTGLGLVFCLYLFAISTNLMISVSKNKEIDDYYRWKIKRTCFAIWALILIIFVFILRTVTVSIQGVVL